MTWNIQLQFVAVLVLSTILCIIDYLHLEMADITEGVK